MFYSDIYFSYITSVNDIPKHLFVGVSYTYGGMKEDRTYFWLLFEIDRRSDKRSWREIFIDVAEKKMVQGPL